MADGLAKRVPPRPALEDVPVKGIIHGHTVIVLECGEVVCGRLTPKSVKRRTNQLDPADGTAIYDVEWQIDMGKVGQKS